MLFGRQQRFLLLGLAPAKAHDQIDKPVGRRIALAAAVPDEPMAAWADLRRSGKDGEPTSKAAAKKPIKKK